ncbi:MAG: VacJ family lipoprotein [Proteobacteria bacterium]|jgi:phospholipid-binding lipoprotein MlaA|nr:VacJ family lipoprotein [Pseudomonadota bacterium]MDA1299176.1 VacJ family lipoprotein [Pseudomonadota bacterium]
MRKWMLLALLVALPTAAQEAGPDPWEGFNRGVHGFNDALDRAALRPLARGYERVVPSPLRLGVGNVFGNLEDITDGVNNLLQGKAGAGATDLLRVLINSTLGLGGLFDPATQMGLADSQEDFGQTLAVWGVPAGPYLVLPLMGPSTVRDGVARYPDGRLDPLGYLYPVEHRNVAYGLRLIDTRAGLLKAESAMFGDRYIFIREAYLQRREFLINDGKVDDAFGDDF